MSSDPIARLRAADPLRGELPPALAAMPRPAGRPAARRRPLLRANVILLAAVTAHGIDHARQAVHVSPEVYAGGAAMAAFTLASLWLALQAHRRAPAVAAAGGPWIAGAVVVSHFLPHWSAFSDSYAAIGADAISYVAAGLVVVAGLLLGVAGVRAARAERLRAI